MIGQDAGGKTTHDQDTWVRRGIQVAWSRGVAGGQRYPGMSAGNTEPTSPGSNLVSPIRAWAGQARPATFWGWNG